MDPDPSQSSTSGSTSDTDEQPSDSTDTPLPDPTLPGSTTLPMPDPTTGADSGSSSTDTDDETDTSTTGTSEICDSPLHDAEDRLRLLESPMRGNPDGWITIVQWTGYADPFSHNVFTTIDSLTNGPLGSEIRIVAKQFPLPFQDPEARFARAALAAEQQDAFWELHDLMFQYEGDLDEEVVDMLATDLGLDLEALHTAMDSPEVTARLDSDAAVFTAVGGTGTPSFIINGELVIGAQPLQVFEERSTAQLDAMQALVDDGLSPCAAFEMRLDDRLP